jgi:hypothetical protein
METSVACLQSRFVLGRMRFNLAFVVTSGKRNAYYSELHRDKVKSEKLASNLLS